MEKSHPRRRGGRMNRSSYLAAVGTVVLFNIVINFVIAQPIGISEGILIVLSILRLHDIGKSGWFVLIGVAIEGAGLAIAFAYFPEQLEGAVTLITYILLGLAIWLGAIRGDPNPNRWGSPPAPSFKRRIAA